MNIYRAKFTAVCPNNKKIILYTLEITTDQKIMVEEIMEACLKFGCGYHEDIAESLYASFGSKQVLIATHHGVQIETRRGFN
jgi:hypothetical protein